MFFTPWSQTPGVYDAGGVKLRGGVVGTTGTINSCRVRVINFTGLWDKQIKLLLADSL